MAENTPFIGAVNVTSPDVKCPGCGASSGLKFDPVSSKIICPFCGQSSPLPRPGATPAVQELDFNSALQRANVDWGRAKKLIICTNCGGETIYDAEQITGACPFCGSTSVTPAAENPQIMAPNGIIPFSVSKDMTQQCFLNFLKRKHCLVKSVLNSRLENVVGIYLPFWTFDTYTVSSFSGEYSSSERFTSVWNQYMDDVIIYASNKTIHPFISKVQNYDFTKIVPYSPEYLAGIPAERYTIGLNEGWERTKIQIKKTLEYDIWKKNRSKFYFNKLLGTNYYNVKFRCLLAPMYLATYRYGRKTFQVAINGQTGEAFCPAPTYIGRLAPLIITMSIVFLALTLFLIVYLYTHAS
jgi:ribosomal protein S27E